MSKTLYICCVFNHPIMKRNSYWEEENGWAQQVKMKQQGHHASFDGYTGPMIPFKEIEDAVVKFGGYAGQ